MAQFYRAISGLIVILFISGLSSCLISDKAVASVLEPYSDPHGNYTSDTPKCGKCHSGHSAGAQGVARLRSQRETCYACHDGSNVSPDIRYQFGEETIGSSVYAGTGSFHPVPTGVQLCNNCHDPHLATDSGPGGTAGLLALGPSRISSGNAVCGYCHGSGSTAPGGDMLTTFTGTAHDITITNPGSGTQIKCTRCHQPHGSSSDALLANRIVSQEGGVYDVTGNNNTLCFGCHTDNTGMYSGKSIYEQIKHGTAYESTTFSESSQAAFSQGTLTSVAANLPGDLTLSGNPGLRFDGINDQLNLPTGYTTTQNTFTYEFWAKPVTNTHGIDPQSTAGTAGTAGQRYAIGAMSGGATGQAGVGVSMGTNGISVYEHANSYMPALLVYSTSFSNWVHIAIVYNNKTPSLYVNGQFVKTGQTSPKIPFPSQRFGWGDYGYYNGSLDDIRLWNYARSQTQIQNDMYKQLAGNESGLIGYWKFNEGSGATAIDSAGTNHGTIVQAIRNSYSAGGNRISPEFDLPSTTAVGSQIQWNSYTPASTALTVDTNVFLGGVWQGWQASTNGETIPGISNGTNLSGSKIKYRANLSTSNTTVTPWLQDVSITVNHDSTVANSVYSGTGYQKSLCLNCHEPHGKMGFSNYLRANGNDLCYGCHVDSMLPAQYSYRGITAYDSTPHVNAAVYGLTYPAGDCLNCHAVHGKNEGTGTALPKQLRLPKADVCFGGAGGACHSDGNNSDRNVNIKDKFTASSNILSHHSINPAEYASGGSSQLECANCHDPHLNNAANKLVDPQNRYTAYTVTNDVSKFIGSENEVFVLVKARHDGRAPLISVNPTTTNTATSAIVDWWTDEPSGSQVYYGTVPGSYGAPVGNSSELVTHHVVTVPGLATGTNYYFKVRSTDAVNNYVESSVYQMDQADPVILAVPAVANSNGTNVTITWNTNEISNSWVYYTSTVDYAVYGDFSHGQGVQSNPVQWSTSHSVTLTGLTPGTTYRYKAYSADYRGRGTESLAPGTFSATNPPNSPVLNELANYSDTSTDRYDPPLTWQAAIDPDGDPITGYYAQISADPNFLNGTTQSSGWTTNLNWTPTIYNSDNVFWYWRVKARDSYNAESAWGVPPVDRGFWHQGTIPPSTSCPDLYVWDGNKYKFVTDLTGGALGKKQNSDGKYQPVYPWLPVVIPLNTLQEKDGIYSIKLKNDRDEVDFIDNAVLTAIDHPEGTEVALNDLERGKKPTKVYAYSEKLRPIKKATYFNEGAYSGEKPVNADITELISKVDGREAKGNYGDDNQFTFDLGDLAGAQQIKVIMTGWTDYRTQAESKAAAKRFQKGTRTASTFYEILQPDGIWKKEPLLHFNGLGKTVVLDLTKKFPEGTKEYKIRLRGMMRARFDFVAVDTTPDIKFTTMDAEILNAELTYHGASVLTGDKKEFAYDKINQEVYLHEGKFTRYGDVMPLVKEVDDKLVVMDIGDQLSLSFKALPPPAPGMIRSFILKPYVYYKEYEMAKVEPMPFRKMDLSKLPDSLGEYPVELRSYIEEWNTREHKAGEKHKDTLEEILDFFTGLGDYITTAWENTFSGFVKEKSKQDRKKQTDTVNTPLTYKLFKDSPYAGFKADKGHYSLNTNYVMLRADTLKDVRNYYSDSADFGMWEHNVEPDITTNKGIDRTGWASKVRTSDVDRWTTDYYPSSESNDGDFNYQMYKFVTTDAAKDVSNLMFNWTGRGEPSPGYNVHFSLWDFQTNSWTEVKQQLAGTEQSLSFSKYVDYNSYCYKCHSGAVPSGVQLGTINGVAINNIGSSYPTDKHGSDNAGQGGFQDNYDGYISQAWRVTSLGTMKSPYSRGHANMPCSDCHDLHGSQNVYHLRENPNGVSVGAIPANTSTATNNQVEAWCQACHNGNRAHFHDYCLQCHNGIGQGHYGWNNYNATQADFNAPCLSCHKHGGATGPHSYGGCHCGFDTTAKAF